MVKNACRRLCGQEITVRGLPIKWEMVPFDVQLIGGIAQHQGKITEMATGEGKTLVATLPVYLNALTGRGVHVVTVNDYLAARDSEWMGAIYKFLGLTVGVILHDQPPRVRREQYACDITYGTNAEFGFDYLRDNGMATRKEEQVQRGHYFAIVDEVDSILIDEARTPLIISGPSMHTHDEQFAQWKPLVESLVRAQQQLCNRFLADAEKLIKKLNPEDGSNVQDAAGLEREIGLLLFRVKTGQPKSEGVDEDFGEPGERRIDEPRRTGTAQGPEEGGPLPREGGIAFRHGRKKPGSRPHREGPQFRQPEGPGGVRAAGFDDAVARRGRGRGNRRAQAPGGQDEVAGGFRGQGAENPRHHDIAQGVFALSTRRGIRHPGKQGHHRGPAHGPAHAGPPLERRVAPGRRGQGRRRH